MKKILPFLVSSLILCGFFGINYVHVHAQGNLNENASALDDMSGGGGETDTLGEGGSGWTDTLGSGGSGTTNTPGGGSTKLANPLKVNTIQELLNLILQVVVTLAVPIIVLFIIYSGFLYVTAQGKPEAIKKATTAFTWTIIGGVIVLGASLLLTVITNTVNALR